MSANNRQRTKRFTVSGEYDNAEDFEGNRIKPGDVCAVRPGAPYKDGDLVLIECSGRCYSNEPTKHYHAKYFNLVNGKKFKFVLRTWIRTRGGRFYKEGRESIIVGPISQVIKQGKKRGQGRRESNPKSYAVEVVGPLKAFGIDVGDTLKVIASGDCQIGQLVAIEKDKENFGVVRVCDHDAETVYTVSHKEVYRTYKRSEIVGPVTEIRKRNAAEVEALRREISRLQGEDESWANTTRIYEIEKQIFDLEHPKEEANPNENAENFFDLHDTIMEGGAR